MASYHTPNLNMLSPGHLISLSNENNNNIIVTKLKCKKLNVESPC